MTDEDIPPKLGIVVTLAATATAFSALFGTLVALQYFYVLEFPLSLIYGGPPILLVSGLVSFYAAYATLQGKISGTIIGLVCTISLLVVGIVFAVLSLASGIYSLLAVLAPFPHALALLLLLFTVRRNLEHGRWRARVQRDVGGSSMGLGR